MSSESNQSSSLSKRDSRFYQAGFLTQHRLPQQVFVQATSNNFLFFEYARAFSDKTWRLFVRLAQAIGESRIWFTTFDPDAQEYYLKHFGMNSEIGFDIKAPATEYTHHMHQWPTSNLADAPAYQADVVAWVGESEQWRCWGERASGLCVLQLEGNERLRKELMLSDDTDFPILTLEEALNDVVSSEYNASKFKQFSDQFKHNYVSSDK